MTNKLSELLIKDFGYELSEAPADPNVINMKLKGNTFVQDQGLAREVMNELPGWVKKYFGKYLFPVANVAINVITGYYQIKQLPKDLTKEEYISQVSKIILDIVGSQVVTWYFAGLVVGAIALLPEEAAAAGAAAAGTEIASMGWKAAQLIIFLAKNAGQLYLTWKADPSLNSIVNYIVDKIYPKGELPSTPSLTQFNPQVQAAQKSLLRLGYKLGPGGANGIIDAATISAIQHYQKDYPGQPLPLAKTNEQQSLRNLINIISENAEEEGLSALEALLKGLKPGTVKIGGKIFTKSSVIGKDGETLYKAEDGTYLSELELKEQAQLAQMAQEANNIPQPTKPAGDKPNPADVATMNSFSQSSIGQIIGKIAAGSAGLGAIYAGGQLAQHATNSGNQAPQPAGNGSNASNNPQQQGQSSDLKSQIEDVIKELQGIDPDSLDAQIQSAIKNAQQAIGDPVSK